MTSVCPHCRSSAEAWSVAPSKGRCPACGLPLVSDPVGLASGDARIFNDEPGDLGLKLEDGSTACPLAFGPYRVLGLIGKGGMGLVYHGVHEINPRRGRDQDRSHPEARDAASDTTGDPRPGPDQASGAGPDHRDRPVRWSALVRDGTPPRSNAPGPSEGESAGPAAINRCGPSRVQRLGHPGRFHPGPRLAEADPLLKPRSDGTTRTIEVDAKLSQSKLETVDQARWSDSKAPTTEEIPVSSEAPTVFMRIKPEVADQASSADTSTRPIASPARPSCERQSSRFPRASSAIS